MNNRGVSSFLLAKKKRVLKREEVLEERRSKEKRNSLNERIYVFYFPTLVFVDQWMNGKLHTL